MKRAGLIEATLFRILPTIYYNTVTLAIESHTCFVMKCFSGKLELLKFRCHKKNPTKDDFVSFVHVLPLFS